MVNTSSGWYGNELGLSVRGSRALGAATLSLPVVVARAHLLVAVKARWDAQALGAALVAEEEAWLLVLRLLASPRALARALCQISSNTFWLVPFNLVSHPERERKWDA